MTGGTPTATTDDRRITITFENLTAGEAAVWPADVTHAAWTEHSEMRAFVVEFMGPDDREVIAGRAAAAAYGETSPVDHAVGQLAPRNDRSGSADTTEGEPA